MINYSGNFTLRHGGMRDFWAARPRSRTTLSRLICRAANNELRNSIIEPQAPRRRQIKSAPSGCSEAAAIPTWALDGDVTSRAIIGC